MRPHELNQLLIEMTLFVVELLADLRGQKGEAFQQAFDVGVRSCFGEHGRGLRMGERELAPQFTQVGQFIDVIFTAGHWF